MDTVEDDIQISIYLGQVDEINTLVEVLVHVIVAPEIIDNEGVVAAIAVHFVIACVASNDIGQIVADQQISCRTTRKVLKGKEGTRRACIQGSR